MPLSEHMYCVAITCKMTEPVEQQICIKFCIKLEHSPVETILIMWKATATGNWWLAASSQQCACSCIMSHAECFGETSNHPGDWAPYSPDLVPCDFWLFPKLKSPLKGMGFQALHEIQEIRWGSWWWLEEMCEVPRCLLWRGLSHHCSVYSVSCILVSACFS